MSLRIACDLDGTLADMEGALQREAERLFGDGVDLRARGHVVAVAAEDQDENEDEVRLPLSPEQGFGGTGEADATSAAGKPDVPAHASRRRPLTKREMRQLWRHVSEIEDFWMTLAEIEPGAVAKLAALAAVRRWEVIFVTKRPATRGDTAQLQSQRWLEAHGFNYPSVYVMNGSRGRLADVLDLHAVIDDRPENCLDVQTDSSARAILVWRDEPSGVPAAAPRVGITVVHQFADALELLQQMDKGERRPTLLGRIRAAIGV